MKVTFFSNFLNHHQLPFCIEMYNLLGDDFKFIATEAIPNERLELGYHDMSEQFPFTINSFRNEMSFKKALFLGESSDVVIIGSAPIIFVEMRNKLNKLTFYYSERIFKKGRWRILSPRSFIPLIKNHTFNGNSNLYMLCSSAYTYSDFQMVGAYKNKAFKWGYFPEIKQHDLNKLIKKKKENKIIKLLWAGRFLDWKHPDDAIKLAFLLKNSDYKFIMDVIGTGPMESKLKGMIQKYDLVENVNMLGSMTPEKVREYMEVSNIFLFTSDYTEGWGAVLNESMNSGCAVVASHAIGSVPFLIKNNENGLIYKNGNIKDLAKKVEYLIENQDECYRLGTNAYKTMSQSWNAKIASERLIVLSNMLLSGKSTPFEEGICSLSPRIKHNFDY